MGVAGSGKTTVGLRIAAALGKEDKKMNHAYAFFKGTAILVSELATLINDPPPPALRIPSLFPSNSAR